MNRFVVEKDSLLRMTELTIEENPDVRLVERVIMNSWKRQGLWINYQGKSAVSIQAHVAVRFGKDIMKAIDKLSSEIQNNLEKLAKVTVKSIQLTVKDIFNEKKDDKNN